MIHEFQELQLNNNIYELFYSYIIVCVIVYLIGNNYPLTPIFPTEVSNAIQFLDIIVLILQTTLSLPRQHPHVPPPVPKEFHPWATELRLGALATKHTKYRQKFRSTASSIIISEEKHEKRGRFMNDETNNEEQPLQWTLERI